MSKSHVRLLHGQTILVKTADDEVAEAVREMVFMAGGRIRRASDEWSYRRHLAVYKPSMVIDLMSDETTSPPASTGEAPNLIFEAEYLAMSALIDATSKEPFITCGYGDGLGSQVTLKLMPVKFWFAQADDQTLSGLMMQAVDYDKTETREFRVVDLVC